MRSAPGRTRDALTAQRDGRALDARSAAPGPVARQPGLQRDQRELLAHLGTRVGQELAPEPVAARECAVHELVSVRDLLKVAELHRTQPLNRPRLEREQKTCL